jgi:hypothetical protein
MNSLIEKYCQLIKSQNFENCELFEKNLVKWNGE